MTAVEPCSWCGSARATTPEFRNGRPTGRWVCSHRGDPDHPRTPCYVPWLLGVSPEEFRAHAADVPEPAAAPARNEVSARLAATSVVLARRGWAVAASDMRTLAWQLRDAPELAAVVADALGLPAVSKEVS